MFTALMITGIIVLAGALFGLAFRLTGAVLMALLWMLKLPFVLVMWALGLVCCCTILLIPVGLLLFKIGSGMLFCC